MKNKLLCISVMTICFGFIAALGAQQSPKRPDDSLGTLRQIGAIVAKAVLDRDVATLLRYDRADLRAEDEISLKDKKSNLYCFLFDSSCLSGERHPSVYEKLSMAQQLGIEVIGTPAGKNVRYAIIMFYDRSKISEQSLRSRTFLCREGLSRIASWSFKLVDGKWQPVTPIFDNETDTLCSPD